MSEFEKILRPTVIVAAAVGFLATGCATGGSGSGSETRHQLSAAEACAPDQAVPLPRGGKTDGIADPRTGAIYPCMYLNDLGIPANTPIDLRKISTQSYTANNFQEQGSTGGFVLGGNGLVSGYSDGSSTSTMKQADVVRFLNPDGSLRTLMLDDTLVKLMPCPDECKPTLTIKTANSSVWYKGESDATSIWAFKKPDSMTCAWDKSSGGYDRQQFVAQIAIRSSDDVCTSLDGRQHVRQYAGGAQDPSVVVDAVASEIIISIPASAQ